MMLSYHNSLMPHFNKESLMCCFNELSGKKAVGIDKKMKEEYHPLF